MQHGQYFLYMCVPSAVNYKRTLQRYIYNIQNALITNVLDIIIANGHHISVTHEPQPQGNVHIVYNDL